MSSRVLAPLFALLLMAAAGGARAEYAFISKEDSPAVRARETAARKAADRAAFKAEMEEAGQRTVAEQIAREAADRQDARDRRDAEIARQMANPPRAPETCLERQLGTDFIDDLRSQAGAPSRPAAAARRPAALPVSSAPAQDRAAEGPVRVRFGYPYTE